MPTWLYSSVKHTCTHINIIVNQFLLLLTWHWTLLLEVWNHGAFIDRFSNTIQGLDFIPILQTGKWKQKRFKGLLQRQTEMWQSIEYLNFLAFPLGPSATKLVKPSVLFYKKYYICRLLKCLTLVSMYSDLSE